MSIAAGQVRTDRPEPQTGLAPSFRIENARIVTPTGILEHGAVHIEHGRIAEIAEVIPRQSARRIDAQGQFLLPGFVDLHGDSLERAVAPRPAAPFRPELALPAYDTELTVHGITTMYHCVALADLSGLAKPLRRREQVRAMIQTLQRFAPHAKIRTRIHLRYEVLDTGSLPMIRELVETQSIDLLSLMDHTPGYGVFRDLDAYRRYRARSGISTEATDAELQETLRLREFVDAQALDRLVALCHRHNIVVASHDDHSAAKIERAHANGIRIAEFPVTWEAAETAKQYGMHTVFGAANLVRGGSHAESLNVSDVLAQGLADILCSDYSPMCMLQGVFQATGHSSRPLHEIVKLFTLHPARAVGIDRQVGSIDVGKAADLILVDARNGIPRVTRTIVNGQSVFITQ